MRLRLNLFQGSPQVVCRALSEAKAEDFTFRIHTGDEQRVVPASAVDPKPESVKYHFDGADYELPYTKFSIQVLPSSKAVNVVTRPSTFWISIFVTVPFLIAFGLFNSAEWISELSGISKDAVMGFAVAVLLVSYITQIGAAFYLSTIRRQREMQAVSSASSLITKLEKASDVEEYFSRLIQVNLSNMEQYYLLVRSQTEKSYGLTQAVSVVGFLILAAGILLASPLVLISQLPH